jgi:hypothetical protein
MNPFYLFCTFLILIGFFNVTSVHSTGKKSKSVWLDNKTKQHKHKPAYLKHKPTYLKNIRTSLKNTALHKENHVLEHTNKPLKVFFITDAKPKYDQFIFKLVISAVYPAVKYDLQYICSCELPVYSRKGYCSSLTPGPEQNYSDIPEEVVFGAQEYAYSIIEKIVGAKYSVTSKPLDIDIEEIQTEKKYAWAEL